MKIVVFFLIILIGFAACASLPTDEPAMAAMAAQATSTAATVAVAGSVATMQAVVDANETRAAAGARATIAAQAVAVQTAESVRQTKEQIEAAAYGTRTAYETAATVTAVHTASTIAIADQARRAWVYDVLAVVGIIFLTGLGWAVVAHLFKTARTVRDGDGDVIAYGSAIFLPSETAVVSEPTHNNRHVRHNTARASSGVPVYRRPFRLTNIQTGHAVYEFTGAQLDALEMNVQAGDRGFRRETSTNGKGMDALLGLTNGRMFSLILNAMKGRKWVEEKGGRHYWTRLGMIDMLHMNALPYSESG